MDELLKILPNIKKQLKLEGNFEFAIDDPQADFKENQKGIKLKDIDGKPLQDSNGEQIIAHVGHIIEDMEQRGKRKRQVLYFKFTDIDGQPHKVIINRDKQIPNDQLEQSGIKWKTFPVRDINKKRKTIQKIDKSSLGKTKKEKNVAVNYMSHKHININKNHAKKIYPNDMFLNDINIRKEPKENNNNKPKNQQPLWAPVNNIMEGKSFGFKVDKDKLQFQPKGKISETYFTKTHKDKKIQVYGTPSHTDMFNEKNLKAIDAQNEWWDKQFKKSKKVDKHGNNILHTITYSNNINNQFNKGYNNLVQQTKYNIRIHPQQHKPIYEPNQNLVKRNALAYINKVNAKNKDSTSNVINNNLQIKNYNPKTKNLLSRENYIDMFIKRYDNIESNKKTIALFDYNNPSFKIK